MLRNRVYIAHVDVRDYGISARGDFEPLVTERVFSACRPSSQVVSVCRCRGCGTRFPLRGCARCGCAASG